MYADIAVCRPLLRTFVYKLSAPVETGCRVIVPFRNRDVAGFVVRLRNDAPSDLEILEIRSVIDPGPLLRKDVFELCQWISNYYVAPIGEVLNAALPAGLNTKRRKSSPKSGGGPDREARARQGEASIEARRGGSHEKLALTSAQTKALTRITSSSGFHPIPLHGVTGSGKTEIYLQAAEHFLSAGNTCLILVPEISLTPQLV